MRRFLIVVGVTIAVAGIGCSQKRTTESSPTESMQTAEAIFTAELTKRGVLFSGPGPEGEYAIHFDEGEGTVSLRNIQRVLAREQDPEVVVRFVDKILRPFVLPPWEKAMGHVYFSAEPSDHDFGDTLRVAVSDDVVRVTVVTDSEEERITWLVPGMLADWGVTQDQVDAAAQANMNQLLADKTLIVENIDGMKLGMAPVNSVFKASIIFAPDFREFVSSGLGWPVFAVIPCRDFIYMVPEEDEAMLNRMGAVIQREYRNSAYPITTEILRISDEGIESVGYFPK